MKLGKSDSGFEVNVGGLFIWYFIQVEVNMIFIENGRDFNLAF